MALITVCYSKCWSCTFGQHYSPKRPHTWMDSEDIEFDPKVEQPTTPEGWAKLAESHPCGCACAKTRFGAGRCGTCDAEVALTPTGKPWRHRIGREPGGEWCDGRWVQALPLDGA